MKPSATTIGVSAPLSLAALWAVSKCEPAVAQVSGSVPSYVKLQSATPGSVQTGNINVSGTAIAAQFQGGGVGLTGVNADKLDGLDSTSFLTSVPVPLNLTGAVNNAPVVSGVNTSNVGTAVGVYGESTATSASTVAGLFNNSSSTGKAVQGTSTATTGTAYGGYFQSNSSTGRALYGVATSSAGTSYAGYFVNQGVGGYGLYTTSAGLIGIEGVSTATSGFAQAGHFECSSTSGISLYAGSKATTGATYALYLENASISGLGARVVTSGNTGVSADATGPGPLAFGGSFLVSSPNGRGVYGNATATAASDTPYGVLGLASVATLGYGVYALGDLGSSGTKSFRIDDPRDPENRYLLHYSSESPFPQNFYVGTTRTDSAGYALVDLPDYFEKINTNIKYQLTVVDSSDDFVLAKVCDEVQGNRFRIRTSKPNVKVSWQVMADRNDDRVRFNRPVDVRTKTGAERGRVQHPEFYGLGPEHGIGAPPTGTARPSDLSRPN